MLRDYQETMIRDARSSLTTNKRILLVGPTGCGKTVLALEMIRGAVAKNRRVLFLCHRRELVRQSSRAFWTAGVEHGMVMAGRAMTAVMANVGVINTVANRIDRMQPPDLIIVDESHRSVSPSYLKLFEAWPNARVVGLTATPERTDGKGLGEVYDAIVQGPSMRWLIDNGYLSDYRIIAPVSSVTLDGVKKRAGDYAQDQLEAAVDKPGITGDAVESYRKYANGKRCMVFCVTIKHSEHVCAQYNAAGIPAEHVDGSHSDSERDAILARFRAGTTKVVCSVQLAIEGLDIPAIEVVQFLRPTASLIVYLQAIGRGLRVEPGKPELIILDQVANWQRHGLPDDDREWSLAGQTKSRKSGDTDAVTTKQCLSCFYVYRAGLLACPGCGTAPPDSKREGPREIDGELTEIDKEAMRKSARKEQGSARTLEDLVALGIRRNMNKPSEWAVATMAAREQRKPKSHEYISARAIRDRLIGGGDETGNGTTATDSDGAF